MKKLVMHDSVELAEMDFETGLIKFDGGNFDVELSFDELEVLHEAYLQGLEEM